MSLGKNDVAAIACVLVDGEAAGTAFLVDSNLAITARHVVSDGGEISLRFVGAAKPQAATLVHPAPAAKAAQDPDWALLQCKASPGVAPLFLHEFDQYWDDDQWASFGYGRLFVGDKGTGDPGALHGNVVAAPRALHCMELINKPAVMAQGFSGAPLFVRGGVIGLISETRAAVGANPTPAELATAEARGAHLAIVPASEIVADWPAKIAGKACTPPTLAPLPFVPALAAALEKALTAECRRSLCGSLGLNGPVPDRRIAQRLVEVSWDEARKALGKVIGGKDPRVSRLLDAMWLPGGAARTLREVLDGPRPIAAIRTRREATVRHHLMRAQGVDLGTTSIHWGDEDYMVPINNQSVAPDAAIEDYLTQRFGDRAEWAERMTDPDVDPIIFVLGATPSDGDLAAIEQCLHGNPVPASAVMPRIVTYGPDVSDAYLQNKPLTAATLITPFPDPALEKKSELRDSKKGKP